MMALERSQPVHTAPDFFGGPVRLLAAHAKGLELLVLDAPHLFDRPGNPYTGPDGQDWPDNGLRFATLARMAALIGQGLLQNWRPDALHLHDWQAALTAAYLEYDRKPRPGVVVTIHNLAFQGQFPPALLPSIGLPPEAMNLDGIEYYGTIGYLKAGLRFADRITTVSPTYAAEIITPEYGMGLDGLLRMRADAVSGILNGIDDAHWNPATDPMLAAPYDRGRIGGRAVNKRALQEKFGLTPDPAAPLFAVISRLTWQKGTDLLLAALPGLLALGGQLAVLGTGDPMIEAALRTAAAAHPGRVGCYLGYDEPSAHLMQAGADILLVPSRFEPCGLTQLYALRYGTIPLVTRVGGLADTVIDASPMALAAAAATGVQFQPATTALLETALRRVVALYRDPPLWQSMQSAAMATDVSWRGPARRYAALFRTVAAL
jgi:starch synthase